MISTTPPTHVPTIRVPSASSPRPRYLPGMVLIAACLLASGAQALQPINAERGGIAIKGYDPVAYFTASEATKGKSKISHTWNGAIWYFTSEENRDLFAEAPTEYAPQYGGYCAYAVSNGSTATVDPKAWKIVDGKLYLNFSSRIQKKWEADIPGHIEAADRNWPDLLAGH